MGATVHKNVVVLARVLERLERSAVRVDAEQYRSVVKYLTNELALVPHGAALEALLESFPAAAEIYENLQYRTYGLCRSPLAKALDAELAARSAIGRARSLSAQKR